MNEFDLFRLCIQLRHGDGQDPDMVRDIVSAVQCRGRSSNSQTDTHVDDIAVIGRAAVEGGAAAPAPSILLARAIPKATVIRY